MSVIKLIVFLSVGLLLFLAALMRLSEGGRDVFAEFRMFWRSRGRFDKFVLAALASLMISLAGAKHGGVQMKNGEWRMENAGTGNGTAALGVEPRSRDLQPQSNSSFSILNSSFDIGLVLVGVGTDETHDFDAPASAAGVTNWLAHGAATDWVKCKM